MCTVSFLPLEHGFILTSNRDERALRKKAIFPSFQESKSGTVIFPKDGEAGGTWVATADTKMICLLNGAFKSHTKQPPYRHSRGKVVLDAFDYESFEEFRNKYNFENLEPHTLIMIEYDEQITLTEFRWDGKKKHIQVLDHNKPNIWSSAPLYSDEVIQQREAWFKAWISTNEFTLEGIKQFHATGGNGDIQNDFLMQREDSLQTISITSFRLQGEESNFLYDDLIQE